MRQTSFNGKSRRHFLASSGAMMGVAAGLVGEGPCRGDGESPVDAFRAWLESMSPEREWLEAFLDPTARVWARFDAELGYLLRNSFMRDGVDGCHTLARYEGDDGPRQQVNFAADSCRIHTYGDSFTQGHQVSDGETWQEVLGAHFCEPVRNFGIGGFGVYQAFRRLRRIETTEAGAPWIVFNIWGDDHLRSILAWRWLIFPSGSGQGDGEIDVSFQPLVPCSSGS